MFRKESAMKSNFEIKSEATDNSDKIKSYKKSGFMPMLIAVAASFTFFVAALCFVIIKNNNNNNNINNNDNKVQSESSLPVSTTTSQSEATSDVPSSENPQSSEPTESKNSDTLIAINLPTGLNLYDMTKIGEDTLLARYDGEFILFDINSYEIIKRISVPNCVSYQKIDDGFVIIDQGKKSYSYDIYDFNGNLIKHVDLPTRKLESEQLDRYYPITELPTISSHTFIVSADGQKVFYAGDNGYCTNSVDLDNEIVIQPAEDFNGGYEEFYRMSSPVLYKDDIVYGTAIIYNSVEDANERYFASLNLKTKEWTVYYKYKKKQQLFVLDSFVENSFIIADVGADQRYVEGKLYYMSVGDKELKEFQCEESIESVSGYISDNAKYILTTYVHQDENTGVGLDWGIKLYDTKTGEILLRKEIFFHRLIVYIDETTRTLYIENGAQFYTLDF